MNKIFIFLIAFLLISFKSLAQKPTDGPQSRPNVQITGNVVEKNTNQPLEYATIIFTPEKGSVTGGITDINGKFDITIPAGQYVISVEFLSFKTITYPKKRIPENLKLGTIFMESDVEALGEVELIAEKSTVEVRLDKKIYNVGQDMTVKGGTASDVLENVPSVTVDAEGIVSLRGNESVRILIDGKPSGLVGLSATDALRQLPADAIQKVEVITSPSARYDAEGTAGIINIILRKGKATGLNASVSLNVGIPENYGVSTNINYRAKKFNLFSNLGYNYKNAPGSAYFLNYTTSESVKISEEIRDYERIRKSFNGNIGMEYYLTDFASVTGGFLLRNAPNESNALNNSFVYNTNQNIILNSNRTENQSESDNLTEFSFNFTQKFDKKEDHKLIFDVKYQDTKEDNNTLLKENNLYPTEEFVSQEKNISNDTQKQWLIKSDYVLPIGEKQQFEAGFLAQLDHNETDYQVLLYQGGNYVLDENVSNFLKYEQDVYAAYIQYGTKFNKLSILTGLRSETTDISVNLEGTSLNFVKNYTKLFPTLNMTYELSDNQNVTLGYNRRIRRPHSRQLNPFASRTSATNIFQGNPAIDPVISNTFDVGYFKKWDKLTLNTSVYFQHAENAIQMIRENTGEFVNGIPVIKSTPINLNAEDRIGIELALNYSPVKIIQLNNSFNFFNYKSNGLYKNVNYGSENVSWNNRFSAKIKLSKKSDFQTTFMYEGPFENAVLRREPGYAANASYSLDLLKNKATLTAIVSDIFNSKMRKVYSYHGSFNSYGEMQWQKRQFNLNFTYRFNQKKKQVKPQQENGGGEEMI